MAKNARLPNGLYRYWYKGKQFYGKTDAEARKKRDDYKYECEHGIEQQLPITVVDYVEQWLPVAKASVKKRTYNEYVTCMACFHTGHAYTMSKTKAADRRRTEGN